MAAVCFISFPSIASAAGAPLAVFPLQEVGQGRNDANLALTRYLTDRLAESGNDVIDLKTVISFMANNRIRTVGHLETLYMTQVRRDLGAAFVLLGTVTQRKQQPEPTLGLILNLVRTSDFRSIWTYVGSISTGEERRVLGIGEPKSIAELQFLLLDEIIGRWPWKSINEEQLTETINIDAAGLEPRHVRPGDKIHCWVRLKDIWPAGEQTPRVFFKADDQLFPATIAEDGITYETSWVAGEKNGRFPVTLLIEWPHYGRTGMALLGSYVVDGTPPVFEIELRGTKLIDGIEVFSRKLHIMPRMIIRKPLSRWRLAFYFGANHKYDDDDFVGDMTGTGNLPESFIWSGRGHRGDGMYEVVLEVWDEAGNSATSSKEVMLNLSLPQVDLSLKSKGEEMFVDLQLEGKIPLQYWRLEMWTKEGRIITQAEGQELPAQIDIELSEQVRNQQIEGFLFYQDILGKQVRQKVKDLLPRPGKKTEKPKKPPGITESWVEEF